MTRFTFILSCWLTVGLLPLVQGQEFHRKFSLSLTELAAASKSNQKTLTKLWQEAAPYLKARKDMPKGVFEGALHLRTIPEKSQFTHELVVEITKLPETFTKAGLNLATAFLPTHFSLSVQKGDTVLFPMEERVWAYGVFHQRFRLPATASGNWEVSPLTFSYDTKTALDNWETLRQLARTYPDERERAQNLNQSLSQINLEDPKQLDTVMFALADIRDELDTLAVYRPLTYWRTDPLRLRILQDKYDVMRQTVSELSQDRYLIYYQQGRDALSEERISDALTAFDKATAYNPDFLPPYQEMARIAYLKGDFEEATIHLEYLWNHPALTDDLRRQTRALFYDIYYFFQQSAQNEAAQLKFAEAIAYLKKGQELCERVPARANCQNDIQTRIQKVRDSEFEYLVGSSRQAMYEDQFAKALRLLQQAKAYQFQHADMVKRNKSYFEETTQEMYERCLSRAAEVAEAGEVKQGVAFLNFAEALEQDYSNLKTPDSKAEVYKTVYQDYYDARLNHADSLAEEKQFNEALDVALSLRTVVKRQSDYITTDKVKEQQVFAKVYRGFLKGGETEIKEGKYRQAVDDLRQTSSIPESAYLPSDLEQARKRQGILKAYLGLSQAAQEEQAWRKAFSFLTRSAVYLPDDPKDTWRVRYDTQKQEVLPQYAQTLLAEAKTFLQEKNKESARKALEDLEKLKLEYGWQPEKEAKKALKKLARKLK